MPRSATSFFLSVLLVATLGVWAQPVQGDVVYTEVLSTPKSQQGPSTSTRCYVYVTDGALRREMQAASARSSQAQASAVSRRDGLVPAVEILSTDQGMVWSLDPSGEMNKGRLREFLRGSEPVGRPARLDALANLKPLSDRAVLRRTGFKKEKNDYLCDHLFATVTCEVKDPRTGETGTLVLMNDLWVADNVPGANEVREFRRALGEPFGLEEHFCRDAGLLAQTLPEQIAKIAKMSREIKGFPVSSTFTAKLRKRSGGGTGRTELLYSLTSEVFDIRSVSSDPRRFEPPVAVAESR